MNANNGRGFQYKAMGDKALLIEFDEVISPKINKKVRGLMEGLSKERIEGIQEVVPAYRSLLVYYDPFTIGFQTLCSKIHEIAKKFDRSKLPEPRVFHLPVCYGGEMGPDLPYVAEHNGLTEEEVVKIHASTAYLVYMLGFLPGFPYLGGLSPKLATPRLPEPRIKIPAGSVGIAGNQTGIYPIESPGGWRIIGRTPVELYTPQNDPPVLLAMGDFVKFFPISPEEFQKIRSQVEDGD